MTSGLTEHTLWEVLELNIRLDAFDEALADADGMNAIGAMMRMMAGGYRY